MLGDWFDGDAVLETRWTTRALALCVLAAACGCAELASADEWSSGAGGAAASSSTGGMAGAGSGGAPVPCMPVELDAAADCASSFVEPFSGTEVPSGWSPQSNGAEAVVAGGGLEIQVPSTSAEAVAFALIRRETPELLAGCSVTVRVEKIAADNQATQTWFDLWLDTGNAIQWQLNEAGEVFVRILADNEAKFLKSVGTFGQEHRWLRVRLGDKLVAWDSSHDGICWTTAAEASGWGLTVELLQARLGAGHPNPAIAGGGTASFDDVEVADLP